MRVKVRFYGVLYELLNIKEVNLELPDNSSLKTLVEAIDSKLNPNFSKTLLDEKGSIRGSYVILLNGSAVREEHIDNVKLNEGDVIAFLPTAVGGKRLRPCYTTKNY